MDQSINEGKASCAQKATVVGSAVNVAANNQVDNLLIENIATGSAIDIVPILNNDTADSVPVSATTKTTTTTIAPPHVQPVQPVVLPSQVEQPIQTEQVTTIPPLLTSKNLIQSLEIQQQLSSFIVHACSVRNFKPAFALSVFYRTNFLI